MRWSSSSRPSPQPSTPQLLLMVSRSVVPCACRASISTSGMPQSPKPPTAREAPSGMSATASAALATTLSIIRSPRSAYLHDRASSVPASHRGCAIGFGGAGGNRGDDLVEFDQVPGLERDADDTGRGCGELVLHLHGLDREVGQTILTVE